MSVIVNEKCRSCGHIMCLCASIPESTHNRDTETPRGVFEKDIPSVAVKRSSFGGGWAWPLNAGGTQALFEFFGEEPAEIPVTGREPGSCMLGYIVEPWQTADLAEHLRSCNLEWEIQ